MMMKFSTWSRSKFVTPLWLGLRQPSMTWHHNWFPPKLSEPDFLHCFGPSIDLFWFKRISIQFCSRFSFPRPNRLPTANIALNRKIVENSIWYCKLLTKKVCIFLSPYCRACDFTSVVFGLNWPRHNFFHIRTSIFLFFSDSFLQFLRQHWQPAVSFHASQVFVVILNMIVFQSPQSGVYWLRWDTLRITSFHMWTKIRLWYVKQFQLVFPFFLFHVAAHIVLHLWVCGLFEHDNEFVHIRSSISFNSLVFASSHRHPMWSPLPFISCIYVPGCHSCWSSSNGIGCGGFQCVCESQQKQKQFGKCQGKWAKTRKRFLSFWLIILELRLRRRILMKSEWGDIKW